MPRGVPLTPDQLAKAAEVFAQTGNYSEAGRAISVAPNTVRDALRRVGDASRRKLHARATERAERQGRKALGENVHRLQGLLRRFVDREIATADDIGIEPKDVASLSNALGNAVAQVRDVGAANDRRKLARLTRDKTRAEVALLARRARQLDDWDELLKLATPDELAQLDALGATLRRRQDAQGSALGAPPEAGGGEAEGDEPRDGLVP